MTTIESFEYAGWENCLRLRNGIIEAVLTTSVGPRIVHVGFADGQNLCHLTDDAGTHPDDGEWHSFGGHRLWHAPEVPERTVQPDNDPVSVERHGDGVTLEQGVEPETEISKALSVHLAPDAPRLTVTHALTNEGPWPVELAPWAITVLAGGGTAVLPQTPFGAGRQADRTLSLWPYTHLDDDRFDYGERSVLVTQDSSADGETKIGVTGRDGWAAYVLDGTALRKSFSYEPDANYADRGAAVQAYTDDSKLELETLAPLRTVDPGETASHVEEWELVDDVDLDDALDPVAAVQSARS